MEPLQSRVDVASDCGINIRQSVIDQAESAIQSVIEVFSQMSKEEHMYMSCNSVVYVHLKNMLNVVFTNLEKRG